MASTIELHARLKKSKPEDMVFIVGPQIPSLVTTDNRYTGLDGLIDKAIQSLSEPKKTKLSKKYQNKSSKKDRLTHLKKIFDELEEVKKADCFYECFGDIKIADDGIVQLLKVFSEKGSVIVTVNYDDIIERVTGLPSILYSPQNESNYKIAEERGVIHLYGRYDDDNGSINVGLNQNGSLMKRNEKFFSAVMDAVCLKQFVFIGFDGVMGDTDPYFHHLRDWLNKYTRGHPYLLVPDPARCSGSGNISLIGVGDDVTGYLKALAHHNGLQTPTDDDEVDAVAIETTDDPRDGPVQPPVVDLESELKGKTDDKLRDFKRSKTRDCDDILAKISSFDSHNQFFDVILLYAEDAKIEATKLHDDFKKLSKGKLAVTRNDENFNSDISKIVNIQLGLENSTKIFIIISRQFVGSREECDQMWNYYAIEDAMTNLIEKKHRETSVAVAKTTKDVEIPRLLRTRTVVDLSSEFLVNKLEKLFSKDVVDIRLTKERQASREKRGLESERDKLRRELEAVSLEMNTRGLRQVSASSARGMPGGEARGPRKRVKKVVNITATNVVMGKSNIMNVGDQKGGGREASVTPDSSSSDSSSDDE